MTRQQTLRRWNDAGNTLARKPEWHYLLLVFLGACLLIVSRRPDAISNPQFFAEDGVIWYADAHNLGGARALFLPYETRGYFCTVPRLAALISQAMPILWAPLLFNIIAIAIEALPAVVLASRRLASALPSRWARLLLAFLYVALPSSWMMISNVTHSQWHLGVLAALVVVATPPEGRCWRGFDIAVAALSGLTGPTCLVLAPVAAIAWSVRRTPWSFVLMVLTGSVAAIQGVSLLLSSASAASYPPLGASIITFGELLARRVVYGALIGHRLSTELVATHTWLWTNAGVLIGVALCGAASLIYALVRAPTALRLLIAFGFLVLLASLLWPIRGREGDAGAYWEALMVLDNSPRYFHAPIFALVVSFVWMLGRKPLLARAGGAAALLVMLTIAVPFDWREPPYRNFQFRAFAQRYDRAPTGAVVQIPTPPGWGMILNKK